MSHPAALPPETIRVQSLETAREHIQKAMGLVSTAYSAMPPRSYPNSRDYLAEVGDSLESALGITESILEALRQP